MLAKVAAALASTEADIVHIDMGQEGAQDASDLRLLVMVRDAAHLDAALVKLRRTPSVLRAKRSGGMAPEV
jgi:GTP pyrophosphokinase